MDEQNSNPYASPNALLIEIPAEGPELASYSLRFGGAFIDGMVGAIILFPLLYAFGFVNWEEMKLGIQPDLLDKARNAVLGFLAFLVIQGYFLSQSGQTIGKKILGMRIVTLDNAKPDFFKLIFFRYMILRAIYLVPVAGAVFSMANCISIFIGKDRRCIHDRFAGTKVILAK